MTSPSVTANRDNSVIVDRQPPFPRTSEETQKAGGPEGQEGRPGTARKAEEAEKRELQLRGLRNNLFIVLFYTVCCLAHFTGLNYL
jgi:hypothetical protein